MSQECNLTRFNHQKNTTQLRVVFPLEFLASSFSNRRNEDSKPLHAVSGFRVFTARELLPRIQLQAVEKKQRTRLEGLGQPVLTNPTTTPTSKV